jgi:hypothetical protein
MHHKRPFLMGKTTVSCRLFPVVRIRQKVRYRVPPARRSETAGGFIPRGFSFVFTSSIPHMPLGYYCKSM